MKKILAMSLAVMMVLSLAACDNGQSAEGTEIGDSIVQSGEANANTQPPGNSNTNMNGQNNSSHMQMYGITNPNISGDTFASRGTWEDSYEINFIITQQDGWYYYAYSADNDTLYPGSFICKMPENGSEKNVVKLFQSDYSEMESYLENLRISKFDGPYNMNGIKYLQVVGEWIYWTNGFGIWKVDINGENFQLVSQIGNDGNDDYPFWVDGEYIYFTENTITQQLDSSTFEYQHLLIRSKADGTESDILFDANRTDRNKLHIEFITSDGRVYFSEEVSNNEDKKIWYLWKNGETKELSSEVVTEFDGGSPIIDERDNIYWSEPIKGYNSAVGQTTFEGFNIHRISEDLSEKQLITSVDNGASSKFCFDSYYIYEDVLYVRGELDYHNMSSLVNRYYMFPLNQNSYTCNMYISQNADDAPTKAFWFNNDTPRNDSAFTTPNDGYLYYLNISNREISLCRALPDGTNWENMTWMLLK